MTYTPAALTSLSDGISELNKNYGVILAEVSSFSQKHPASYEYLFHGFIRRLGILQGCIQNVFSLYPPDRLEIPSRETCVDLAINLQSFVFNVFGCLDNLAWISVIEHQLRNKNGPLKATQVGFRQKLIQNSFSLEFQLYLENLSEWFTNIETLRNHLAHRIPLYVPPFVVTPDSEASFNALEKAKVEAWRQLDFIKYDELDAAQEKMGKFRPIMTHSVYAGDGYFVYFHGQILADWITLIDITERFLRQSNW